MDFFIRKIIMNLDLFVITMLESINYSPKSLSSAETDLVESTTVQQLWRA
jgi:hypothetical protein